MTLRRSPSGERLFFWSQFRFMEGQRQSQVPAALFHAVVHLRGPVVMMEQIVD